MWVKSFNSAVVVKGVTPCTLETHKYWSVLNVRCIIYNMHIICLTMGFSKAVWRRRVQCCCFYFSLWNKWYRPSPFVLATMVRAFFFSFHPSRVHPPSPTQQPSARTAICCGPHKYTQHPGVPYPGEKLSIPVSFLRLGSRARAHEPTHTHTHSLLRDRRRKRKKKFTHILYGPTFASADSYSAAAAAVVVMAPV